MIISVITSTSTTYGWVRLAKRMKFQKNCDLWPPTLIFGKLCYIMDTKPSKIGGTIYGCIIHRGQIPRDGENGQNVAFFYYFFEAVLWPNDLISSTFLNCSEERFCPLDSKNVFTLVLAHLEPELEQFERLDIDIYHITCITYYL